jgi:hypothetical protein
MRCSLIWSALGPRRVSRLLSLASLWACGDANTAPIPIEKGYVLNISIPGLTDTTFQGDSLYWRVLTGRSQAGDDVRQLDLELLVLNPPAPLVSPLQFVVRWYKVDAQLPAAQTYALGLNPPAHVLVQANSNLGTWGASRGQVTLTEVTDTSISGALTATLEPVYPPGTSLPDVRVEARFWAPHVPDLSVGS